MNKVMIVALAAASAFATSGCATVLNGTNIDYSTETRPEGATAKFTSGLE